MRKNGIVILFLLSVTFNNCTDIIAPHHKGQIAVVMCDITKSLDSVSIKKITEKAVDILKALPNADIYYYPIDSNVYSTPLMIKKSYVGMRTSEIRSAINSDEQKLRDTIYHTYSVRNARASCVVKCFQKAYNKFKEFTPCEDYEFYLVFLSDMLEYCEYNYGKLNLEQESQFESTIQKLEIYEPGFDLAKLGVKITVVMTAHKKLPIPEELHAQFWKAAFTKIGYQESDFNLMFYDDLPKNFGKQPNK